MDVTEDLNKKQNMCMLLLYHILQYLQHFKLENNASDIFHVLENWVRFYYKRDIRCGMCNEKDVAVGYCRDCEKPWFIDGLCLKFHKKINTLESHRLIEFTKDGRNHRILDFAPQNFCENHKETELELYCKKCKIIFCEKCEGKKHDHNHNVHSTKHIYILLDNVHDTKRQIEGILQTQQNLCELEHKKLTTMIMWIDVALGIVKRYSDIKDVPIPPEINRLFENELSTNKSLVKYKEVIAKLAEIQGDLRLVFTSDALCEEDTIPKVARTNEDQHKQGGVINLTLRKPNKPPHTEIGMLNNVPVLERNDKLNQEDTSSNNGFLTCPEYMYCMPFSNEDLADVLFTGTTNVMDRVILGSSKDMFIPLQEMGFENCDIEKAYEVLKKSGREDITVYMLLSEILETQEGPTDVSSSFASQQRRRDEKECKNEVGMICKICSENRVTTAFLPCGHLAACVKCAPALKKCPICRTVIRVT